MEDDKIEHPPHYTKGKIEMSQFIRDQDFNWDAGNVIKYLYRYRYKGTPLDDLKKAQWYLKQLIEKEKKDEKI